MKAYLFKSILLFSFVMVLFGKQAHSAYLLLPMDESQSNHLKAYGISYWVIEKKVNVDWLLNYRGGSFMFPYHQIFEDECNIRGVSYQVIADAQAAAIVREIAAPDANMDVVKLHKAPKIAIYSPKNKQPWDDAVTMALSYAEIPYDVIYDPEVMDGKLITYDWLHLHHEDFTGQYGKFWARYKTAAWYINNQKIAEETARSLGFSKVSQLKLAVAQNIQKFVLGGGYLFAMCSAPDSFDVALAAAGVDICEVMFDGDPADPQAQEKLNYENCMAFTNFRISQNPQEYEISNIDILPAKRHIEQKNDLFTLFEFSAKWDPVPTMLCQNHESVVRGFMGQTTAFNKNTLKSNVLVMGENKALKEARYIHGDFGQGTWTFYGGHDPEDYRHFVGDPKTDLNIHPNSSGYRLILNNVL
ncbi:MAG: asparagine synthetase B, partial [Bacteroidales bacterium]|nr:asparagine synthetase B [Bacteroidales bacterium]